MKEITIPISDHYCLVSETDRVYEQGQGGYLCDTTFQYELETARTNGGKILFATSSIEQKLDFVISSYFFDLNQQDNPKKTFFETEVLSLSNFTFSTKRKIFLKIINNAHLIN